MARMASDTKATLFVVFSVIIVGGVAWMSAS